MNHCVGAAFVLIKAQTPCGTWLNYPRKRSEIAASGTLFPIEKGLKRRIRKPFADRKWSGRRSATPVLTENGLADRRRNHLLTENASADRRRKLLLIEKVFPQRPNN